MSTDDLPRIVIEEFENKFGWAPDDLDLNLAGSLAKAVCARIGVDPPDVEYPISYAAFAEALGAGHGAAPAPDAGLPEVSSEGGPILVIPMRFAPAWQGTDGDEPTDYDRCCTPTDGYQPTEYGGLDWVIVGDGRALVLDLELTTTAMVWRDGAVIARNWSDLPSEDDLGEWCSEASWTPFEGAITLEDGRLALFDSAAPGAADPDAIPTDGGVILLNLTAGSYGVSYAERDGVELVRLSPST